MAAQILARHSALAALPELSEDLGLCFGQKVAEVQSTLPARPEDSNEVAVAENDFPERRRQLREVVVNEQQRKAEAPCSRERCFEPATERRSVKQMEEFVKGKKVISLAPPARVHRLKQGLHDQTPEHLDLFFRHAWPLTEKN